MRNTKYVVGLVFDETERVMLIEKKRPDWQKGLLNGVGGEIRINESPIDAMIRECKEESGLYIDKWHLYDTVTFDNGVELHYFCCLVKSDFLDTAQTLTDENIVIYHRSHIKGKLHEDIKQMIIDFIARYELIIK
ncbi:NUDIX domain-containing protein [Aliarcobacter butzleri]|uniref:NUDIX domain-containing protein n=1 Tax=Aliarcobacter butzleri TaxID=28197 RepID=UPI001269A9B8|nr:NUDIX domain-containing protein [Aliarcobacter butzleri]